MRGHHHRLRRAAWVIQPHILPRAHATPASRNPQTRLGLQDGLDDVLGPAAQGDGHGVVLRAPEEALVPHEVHDLLPALEALEAREGATVGVHAALVVQDVDELEPVALPGGEVVRVVGGRDLDRARPERHVHQLGVADHGHLAAQDRVDQKLAVQSLRNARGEGMDNAAPSTRPRDASHRHPLHQSATAQVPSIIVPAGPPRRCDLCLHTGRTPPHVYTHRGSPAPLPCSGGPPGAPRPPCRPASSPGASWR